uniref:Peptidase M3A/M3B catalytic domain-containing protein n=1 Tax=Leersia perrieri TaxID=77586 RepID=A0A0D9V958_9ORYZ
MEKLKSHIDDLNLKYIQSLNDSTKFLLLSEEELAAANRSSSFFLIFKVGSTRKLIAVAYGQKGGKENIAILEKLVQLRHRLARLLGYPNYADYAIEPRMPRTSRKMEEENDAQFGVEDLLYYMKRAEELKVDLDIGEIKQYFPVDLVISGMLKMFQDLFALRFEEIKDAETWHDTVRFFSVWDASSSDLLGYFFLDIFSREGKYAHTCVMALQNGCLCSNGTRKVPVAVLLSQCPKEFDGNSSLLRFPEVVRIFHEFSHVGDFAEIPSLLLENWTLRSLHLEQFHLGAEIRNVVGCEGGPVASPDEPGRVPVGARRERRRRRRRRRRDASSWVGRRNRSSPPPAGNARNIMGISISDE